MKKSLVLLGLAIMITTVSFAKKKGEIKNAKTAQAASAVDLQAAPMRVPANQAVNVVPQQAPQAVVGTPEQQNPDKYMKMNTEEHDFGTVAEGPAVSYDFELKNISREPIVLSNVQASCGCTTPSWSKDPILPGKTSKITATFNTQGRPGQFIKTITINSNVGSKVVRIKGNVEKAPDTSVPVNNNSIMKH